MNTLSRFIKDDSGADLVEYALIIGLVSLAAAVTARDAIVPAIGGLFTKLKDELGKVSFAPPAGS